MEPISLTLGIIPLLGVSLKVYRSAYSKLKVFRRYSREVTRVHKHFERQRQFFINETRLILRSIVRDEGLLKEMVEDGRHSAWSSTDLEKEVQTCLGDNCRIFREIVEDIGATINEVQEGLECFDDIDRHRDEVRTDPSRVRYFG